MDIEHIFDIFCRLTGLAKTEAAGFRFLCEGAAGYLNTRLAAAPDRKDLNRIFFAAAALACYRYSLMCMTEGNGGEIKIGDISMKSSGMKQVDSAEKLCHEAFREISDLITDPEFVFKGV